MGLSAWFYAAVCGVRTESGGRTCCKGELFTSRGWTVLKDLECVMERAKNELEKSGIQILSTASSMPPPPPSHFTRRTKQPKRSTPSSKASSPTSSSFSAPRASIPSSPFKRTFVSHSSPSKSSPETLEDIQHPKYNPKRMLRSLFHPSITLFLFPLHSRYLLISTILPLKFPPTPLPPTLSRHTQPLLLHVHHSLFVLYYPYHSHLDAHVNPFCRNSVLLRILPPPDIPPDTSPPSPVPIPHSRNLLLLHQQPSLLYYLLTAS